METAILLVEDEPISRRNLALFLKTEGYSVADTGSGGAALDLIRISKFDAVISDYRLGNSVNGLDVLKHFQQRFPGKGKILLSGTLTDLESHCESLGVLFIHKPFQLDDILVKLKSLLPTKSTKDEAAPAHITAEQRAMIRRRSVALTCKSGDLHKRFQEIQTKYQSLQARMHCLQTKLAKKFTKARQGTD